MEKILFLFFLISLIYCKEEYFTFKKDKLYNDKCALFISKDDNITLIYNQESNCLDECIAYNSGNLEDVFYGFCYNSYDFYKLSGENCNGNYDCFSKNCKDNKCIGKSENEECEENAECNVGLYCNKYNICENLKDEEEYCSELNEDETLENMNDNCYAGLVCNYNKCVKLGSLSYNNSKYNIDNKFSCKSGFEEGDSCIDYISEKILEDSSENQCLLTKKLGEETIYEVNNCKTNLFGKKVTAKQIRFDNFQNYVNEYNKQLNEIGKKNVHVLNKLSLGNKSLINKYLDSKIGYLVKDVDNDLKTLYYNNYFYLYEDY